MTATALAHQQLLSWLLWVALVLLALGAIGLRYELHRHKQQLRQQRRQAHEDRWRPFLGAPDDN